MIRSNYPDTKTFTRKEIRHFTLKLVKAEPTEVIAEIRYKHNNWFATYEHNVKTGFTSFNYPKGLTDEQFEKLLFVTRRLLTDPLGLVL